MESSLRIATRGSKLALIQYDILSNILQSHGIVCRAVEIKSHGENDTHTPLYKMNEQGVFVKRLNEAILEGKVDAAVHSAKDIPNDIGPELEISYYSQRADPRDYFVSNVTISNFFGTVGSSSIRRRMFLALHNKGLKFIDMRGNIDSRIRKWANGEVGSIVVAKAALDRMGITPPGEVISEEICPPDPNQGFIAVVTKRGSEIGQVLKGIQDKNALWEASRERDLMVRLELGCNLATSIRAIRSQGIVKFAYANEDRRFDLSFKDTIEESDIKKMRDILGT
ncbi:MAG: hydroxymethylbilane synthase [Thermoplasmata archaeon]